MIVGDSTSTNGSEAFRWTSGGGMVGLGDLPGGSFFSIARDVSADGSVIVGRGTSTNGGEAFRWISGGGMVGLGDLPGGIFNSSANGVSGDGSVIVGFGNSTNGEEAFRWTSGGGMVGLGDLPGGEFESFSRGTSADGNVIVGHSNIDAGLGATSIEAFRWTSGSGMVGLGNLTGGIFQSYAFDVSGDGGVVVGHSDSASGNQAFLWTQAGGMVNLKDFLVSNGVSGLTNWTLKDAYGISVDGTTIVGYGTNPSGNSEAWRATIAFSSSAPEPCTLALLTLGMVGGIVARRRK